jgi:hypothetical protein
MRREKTQISKIRNTKGRITTNTMEIQEIIRERNGQISRNLQPPKTEPRRY